jgi:hypothetical protein
MVGRTPEFLGKNAEVYLTLAVLFWCCCAALGLGSRVLERAVFPESVHQVLSGDDRGPASDAIVRWLTAPSPAGTVRA